ncbi:MAG: exonuclease large subunit [Planctomycetota bacterium]|nr:exonuclease large subunit [Planctomycetota bacterium]
MYDGMSGRESMATESRQDDANCMIHDTRLDLSVPYARKEEAKALGARWDGDRRTWYAPPGTDLRHFDHRWLPSGFGIVNEPVPEATLPMPDGEAEKGVSLSELLARVKGVISQGLPDAEWVRAEISELSSKNGNFYLQLTERNERGDPLGRAKGIIWKGRATGIAQKFVEATGEGLKTDIKILCLVRVRFDPLYGLDLTIEDVDPSFTLGDLAAKLARIRLRLVEERLYERNQALSAPVEFVRVAVISPETSAGLGDFRRETDRLQNAGLCGFHFFGATFQGLDAPSSIRTAVNEALAVHRHRPFDALVIIRGGGSVTDLAWLNDLELARLLCQAPIPLFTGIGHERDNTILDEIAHRRFDTPSKVALHIAQTIRDNAVAAITALERIKAQVGRILGREQTALATQNERLRAGISSILDQAECDRERFLAVIRTATHYRLREERTAIEAQAERLKTGVRLVVQRAEDEHENFTAAIRTAARYQIRESSRALDSGYARLIGTADQTLCEARLATKQSIEAIAHRTELRLGDERAAIEKAADAIALQAEARIEAAGRDLDRHKGQMVREAGRWVTTASAALGDARNSIETGSASICKDAHARTETFARLVVGLGPQATLRRGFSIVRDYDDKPITCREAAVRTPTFVVQFHDGDVPVTNRQFMEGDDR